MSDEKQKSGSTFNFDNVSQNVTGQGAVGQVGQNTAEVNNSFGDSEGGDWKPAVDELLDKVKDLSWPEGTPETVSKEHETPAVAVSALYTEIESDVAADEKPEPDKVKERESSWGDTLKAMLPLGLELTTKVGAAVAQNFVETSGAGVAATTFFGTLADMATRK